MEKIGKRLANLCVYYDIIDEENSKIIVFGMSQLLFFFINFSVIQFIAILMHEWLSSVIYTVVYMSLSRLTGGYHASTRLLCSVKTILVFLCYLFLVIFIAPELYKTVQFNIIAVSLVVMWKLTPLRYKNKYWTKKQLKNNNKKAVLLVVLLFFLALIMENVDGLLFYGFQICLAILCVTCLIVIGYFFNKK